MGIKHLDIDEQIAFVAIMSRNWFSRMWILQECVLSSCIGILLGDFCFNYQLLLHAANVECAYGRDYRFSKTVHKILKTHPELAAYIPAERTFNSITKLVRIGQIQEQIASNRLPDFLSVIASSRLSKAEDPRDRIFAVLDIVSEFEGSGTPIGMPDYTEEIRDVFVRSTFSIIVVTIYINSILAKTSYITILVNHH